MQRQIEAIDCDEYRPLIPRSSPCEHHVGNQGGFIERHLFAASRFNHVDAHPFHHPSDFEAGCGHMLKQGRRERAVAAVAVEGDVIRLGGKCRERADRVLDRRQALGLGEPAGSPPERVVAAGVEKDQLTRCSASILASTWVTLTAAVLTLAPRPARGRLRRSHPQGREAGRSSGSGADQGQAAGSVRSRGTTESGAPR